MTLICRKDIICYAHLLSFPAKLCWVCSAPFSSQGKKKCASEASVRNGCNEAKERNQSCDEQTKGKQEKCKASRKQEGKIN